MLRTNTHYRISEINFLIFTLIKLQKLADKTEVFKNRKDSIQFFHQHYLFLKHLNLYSPN